ncbi:unnamed protein product [Camellia sinensis]
MQGKSFTFSKFSNWFFTQAARVAWATAQAAKLQSAKIAFCLATARTANKTGQTLRPSHMLHGANCDQARERT